MRSKFLCVLAFVPLAVAAKERKFDFSEVRENQAPPGFRSAVTGEGKAGDWRIILDEVPPLLPALTPQALAVSKKPVLAQLAQDPTDEHFPVLIFDEETFGDFTLTTRFKTVRGAREQMAGVAFRIQNETNCYVVRASSLGSTFRFYKVVNGERGTVIGPEVQVPGGVWHDLAVECKGHEIRCRLDDKELIPPLTDNSFLSGKIGFWTKSDSVSYFCDTKIVYVPREVPAQVLVRDMVRKYPRLLGLKVYVAAGPPKGMRVIASKEETEIGQPGGKIEQEVTSQGTVFYGNEKGTVSVTMPLRDRNGEIVAAVRVILKSFAGQTEQNALVRASAIIKAMQERVQSTQDLVD